MAQILASQASPSNIGQLQAQRRSRTFRRRVLPWLFVLPILVINFVVIIGPSISAVVASFTDWNGIGTANFIGLDNYQRLLTDADYGAAFTHNLLWLVIFMTIPIALALIAASLLAPLKRGGMIIRTGLFFSYVLPSGLKPKIFRKLF